LELIEFGDEVLDIQNERPHHGQVAAAMFAYECLVPDTLGAKGAFH
jgi:hypothetical protein